MYVKPSHTPLQGSPWRHLAAGAAAGAASRTATAPLETLRLQAMAGCLEAPGLVGAFRATLARGGWGALYKAWHGGTAWRTGSWLSMQSVPLGAQPEPALAQPCCMEGRCVWPAACWPQVPCGLTLILLVIVSRRATCST